MRKYAETIEDQTSKLHNENMRKSERKKNQIRHSD